MATTVETTRNNQNPPLLNALGLPGLRKALFALAIISVALFAGSSAAKAQNVNRVAVDGNVEIWQIKDPVVTAPDTSYKKIIFRRGDTVFVNAGGCVQTGGRGNTWKRFVDPIVDTSDAGLYHGTITLPGMPAASPIDQFLQSNNWHVPNNANGDMTLHIGYTDDDFSDNGYYGHDDGTGNQCQFKGDAWVEIVIIHQPSTAPGH